MVNIYYIVKGGKASKTSRFDYLCATGCDREIILCMPDDCEIKQTTILFSEAGKAIARREATATWDEFESDYFVWCDHFDMGNVADLSNDDIYGLMSDHTTTIHIKVI